MDRKYLRKGHAEEKIHQAHQHFMNRYKFKRAQVLSSTFKGHATFHFVHVLKMKMFMVFGQTKKDKDTLSPRSHTIL